MLSLSGLPYLFIVLMTSTKFARLYWAAPNPKPVDEPNSFTSRYRNLACLQVLKRACEQTRLSPAMVAYIRRFVTYKSLLDHIESLEQWATNQSLHLELFRKNGLIDQVRDMHHTRAFSGKTSSFRRLNKDSPLSDVGCLVCSRAT